MPKGKETKTDNISLENLSIIDSNNKFSGWVSLTQVQCMYRYKTKVKPHWTMNRYINNEGQEWKTGHTKERALTSGWSQKKEVKKVNMVDTLSIQ
jgi:hypothetical protein